MNKNCQELWDEGWQLVPLPCQSQWMLLQGSGAMLEAARSPPGAGGGISNLDTFCLKSQAHFSNLLSLTQIQNNMRIKK